MVGVCSVKFPRYSADGDVKRWSFLYIMIAHSFAPPDNKCQPVYLRKLYLPTSYSFFQLTSPDIFIISPSFNNKRKNVKKKKKKII